MRCMERRRVIDGANDNEDDEDDDHDDDEDEDNEYDDKDGDDEDDDVVVVLFIVCVQVYPAYRGLPMRHRNPATAGSITLRNRGLGEKASQQTIHSEAEG